MEIKFDASIVVSSLAFLTSICTAWFTIFHRGTVKISRPSIFALLPSDSGIRSPKVFFRTLLFSTGKRGRVIENMFARVNNGKFTKSFMYWAHGEREALVPGSGLFVGSDGIQANHHFMLTESAGSYKFESGSYQVEILGSLIGKKPKLLHKISFELSREAASALNETDDSAVMYLCVLPLHI